MSFRRCPSLLSRSKIAVHPRSKVRFYSTPTTKPNTRLTAFLAGSCLAGAAALYYYESQSTSSSSSSSISKSKSINRNSASPEFSIKIQHSNGVKEYKFLRKSDEEAEKILTVNQQSKTYQRSGNPVGRVDTNWVGSNEPCEDRSAIDLVPRSLKSPAAKSAGLMSRLSSQKGHDPDLSAQSAENAVDRPLGLGLEQGDRDLMFFSVLDGHAGDATSQLLSKVLHPTLTIALAGLEAGYMPFGGGDWKHSLASYLGPLSWVFAGPKASFEPANVSLTLQNAFLQLDENICQTPIRLLKGLKSGKSPATTASAGQSPTPNEAFIAMTEPADAGACAITALVDAENDSLYVALAGDCRAVAGWQGADGKWRCDVLTEDQMGENPREVARMKSEHPSSEAESVIRGGRIQGGLQPTRAFGDAVYKWTMEQASAIAAVFLAEGKRPRPQRPGSLTPPYCTARPEVTHRKLKSEDGEKLRFLIMATDGLWDRITSEEAALLVSAYLAHPKHSDISKTSLPASIPFRPVPPTEQRLYPVQDLPGSPSRSDGSWVFEGDDNAATHLIRNSLAGAERNIRAELLSLSGKVSRWMRDDITVTVVFFND